jgi:hypothetical protein
MSDKHTPKLTPPPMPGIEANRHKAKPQRTKPDPVIESIRAVDAALHLLAPHLTDGVVFEIVERLSTMRPEMCQCLEAIEYDSDRQPHDKRFASELRLYLHASSAFAQGNACEDCYPERCLTTKIGGAK